MDDAEVWQAVDRRRAALADLFEGLAPEQWEARTLCEAWTVRDLAGHLTMPLLGLGGLLAIALRHPGGTNTVIREGSIDLGRRSTPEELVRRIRATSGRHRPVPGLTVREALVDAVGHTLDLAIPLGLPVDLPPAEVAEAADRVVGYAGRGNAKVFAPLPWPGRRLQATDHPWTTGDGPLVTGTMNDLFLLITGRDARLDALAGEGAAGLRAP